MACHCWKMLYLLLFWRRCGHNYMPQHPSFYPVEMKNCLHRHLQNQMLDWVLEVLPRLRGGYKRITRPALDRCENIQTWTVSNILHCYLMCQIGPRQFRWQHWNSFGSNWQQPLKESVREDLLLKDNSCCTPYFPGKYWCCCMTWRTAELNLCHLWSSSFSYSHSSPWWYWSEPKGLINYMGWLGLIETLGSDGEHNLLE